jgi:DNA-binding MarR family transcriptional regulator
MFENLNSLFLSQTRLAILSLLISHREMEFTRLRDMLNSTPGNLSIQLSKLKKAGMIEIKKSFRENYPLTVCRITPKGVEAFEKFMLAIKTYKPKRVEQVEVA